MAQMDDWQREGHEAVNRSLGIFDAAHAYAIPFETRLEAAEALGKAGDPRILNNNWVRLTGPFLVGEPRRQLTLQVFEIGRYPVTVAQYKAFVENNGYLNNQWWNAGGFGEERMPMDWDEQLEHPNRPVVGVNWYEAAAYCAWAGGRLPTSDEWEATAQGKDGREYPWGGAKPDETRANYWLKSSPKHPTPVGLYPAGATPEGIQDLAGNVWEWVADWYDDEMKYRELRGGSWDSDWEELRGTSRDKDFPRPGVRSDQVGFRCVRKVVS